MSRARRRRRYRHSEFRRMVEIFSKPNFKAVIRALDASLQQTYEVAGLVYGVEKLPPRKPLTPRRMAAEWVKDSAKKRRQKELGRKLQAATAEFIRKGGIDPLPVDRWLPVVPP